MKIGMYSVYDKESDKYDTPFFSYNDVMAKRRFMMDVNDPSSVFSQFAPQFELVKLATFDVLTGEYDPDSRCVLLKGSQINIKEVD
jgi:hypothetical protein